MSKGDIVSDLAALAEFEILRMSSLLLTAQWRDMESIQTLSFSLHQERNSPKVIFCTPADQSHLMHLGM
jgi:hypothetical protein